MTRLALALILAALPVTLAHALDFDDSAVTKDQIVKYQELPQTVVVRIRKGSRSEIVQAACSPIKLGADDRVHLKFISIVLNDENQTCPVSNPLLVKVMLTPTNHIHFVYHPRYSDASTNAYFRHIDASAVAGALKFISGQYEYDYHPYYSNDEDLNYHIIYYSWN